MGPIKIAVGSDVVLDVGLAVGCSYLTDLTGSDVKTSWSMNSGTSNPQASHHCCSWPGMMQMSQFVES